MLSCSLLQETLKATTYIVDILLSVEGRSGLIIIIESKVEVFLFMCSDVIIRAEIKPQYKEQKLLSQTLGLGILR